MNDSIPKEVELIVAEEVPVRLLAIETAVVLCLAYLPFMTNAVLWINVPWPDDFSREMISHAVSSLQVLAPLLYIMWRSSGGWGEFGITKPEPLMDGVLALVLFSLAWLTTIFLATALAAPAGAGEDVIADRPSGLVEHVLLVVAMIANSLSEEFFMRAYLITRLRQLGAHWITAVVVSALLFASYHIYQGYSAITPVAVNGLIYGATFALTRRVWPLVASHTLYNLLIFTHL